MEFNNIGTQVVDVDGDIEGREDNPGSPDPPPIWSEVLIISLIYYLDVILFLCLKRLFLKPNIYNIF